MSIRLPAALGAALLMAVSLGQTARAHEGHDHDAPKPAVPNTVAPRGEAISETFELVAVARGNDLTLYLDHARTNEPVRGASITVETRDGPQEAASTADSAYTLAAPWIAAPGHHALVVAVAAGGTAESLMLALDIPDPREPAAEPGRPIEASVNAMARQVRAGLPGSSLALASVAGAAFLLGMLATALLRGRSAVALLALGAFAITVLFGSAALAHGDDDHDGGHQHEPVQGAALTLAPDLSQRLPDGSVFVPKSTQHLLSIRTEVIARASHRRSVELPGRIIPDPNASGVVQSAVGGRLAPPASGLFPRLGARVKRGDILATVTPPVQAIDVSDMRQTQGELDQQIAITGRRVERYRRLAPSGAVAQIQLDDALAELKGLQDRRGALDAIRREPEALRAPVDGVVAQAAAIAGQMAAPGTMVFQIVDPEKLWIEALSFDALTPSEEAAARLADGRSLRLAYRGSGLADRNQAIPVQFAIEGDAAGLRVGQFVTVLAGTEAERAGLAVPRTAVVRTGDGRDVVYEHVAAERFAARPVRVEALDGARIFVAQGLAPDRRIVVSGAELLDQVR